MIYFDNAATTRNKPQEVIKAFNYYVTEIGVSPGRGSYGLGIKASRMLYQTREKVANYFGLQEPNVIFTQNSTEAINLFFNGVLQKGDHVLISPYEHNAVLRPLQNLKEQGVVEYTVISREDLILSGEEFVKKYIKENTKLLAMTLASNITGRIILNEEWFVCAKKNGLLTFLDASQGAGKIRINMVKSEIDYLAFTGHKDLRSLPGVGGLCSVEPLSFRPLIQGGTGIYGHEKVNPKIYPEGYEAGTINMPAVWSLNSAIDCAIRDYDCNTEKEKELTQYLIERLNEIPGIIIYDKGYQRVSTVGFNLSNVSSNNVVKILDNNEICVRGGIHCAIIAHETLGTEKQGLVRVSLAENNSKKEIDLMVDILKTVGDR